MCRVLGCTLNELYERMSVEEFLQWQKLDAEWPMDDLRSDLHAAQISQSVTNMSGKSVKKPVPLEKFVLFQAKEEEVSPYEHFRRMQKGAKGSD